MTTQTLEFVRVACQFRQLSDDLATVAIKHCVVDLPQRRQRSVRFNTVKKKLISKS